MRVETGDFDVKMEGNGDIKTREDQTKTVNYASLIQRKSHL